MQIQSQRIFPPPCYALASPANRGHGNLLSRRFQVPLLPSSWTLWVVLAMPKDPVHWDQDLTAPAHHKVNAAFLQDHATRRGGGHPRQAAEVSLQTMGHQVVDQLVALVQASPDTAEVEEEVSQRTIEGQHHAVVHTFLGAHLATRDEDHLVLASTAGEGIGSPLLPDLANHWEESLELLRSHHQEDLHRPSFHLQLAHGGDCGYDSFFFSCASHFHPLFPQPSYGDVDGANQRLDDGGDVHAASCWRQHWHLNLQILLAGEVPSLAHCTRHQLPYAEDPHGKP